MPKLQRQKTIEDHMLEMNAKKIPRMDIPLDIEAKHFQRDESLSYMHNFRSAEQNKKLYMDTYTTKFNIPAQYVLQS